MVRKMCAEKLENLALEFNQQEMCEKFTHEASELLEDEEISIKIQALVSYFNVIYAKSCF